MTDDEKKDYLSAKAQEMVIDCLKHMEKLFDDPRDFITVLSFFIPHLWVKYGIVLPGKLRETLMQGALRFMKNTAEKMGDFDFEPEDLEAWEYQKSLDEK